MNTFGLAPDPSEFGKQQEAWLVQPNTQHMQHPHLWYENSYSINDETVPGASTPPMHGRETHNVNFMNLESCHHTEIVQQNSPQHSEWSCTSQRSSHSSPYPLSEFQAYTPFGNALSQPIKVEDGLGWPEQNPSDFIPSHDATHGMSDTEESLHSQSASPTAITPQPASPLERGASKDYGSTKEGSGSERGRMHAALERRKRSYTTEETAKCYYSPGITSTSA
ncbi:hypothetical protein MBLNU459_g7388t1 [Dothideomycetes sp. NU459]